MASLGIIGLMRGLVKAAGRAVLHRTGALDIVRSRSKHAARILTYHRFTDASLASLAEQCAYLRDHYQPVPMSRIAAWLEGREPLPDYALAVTVDDGYRDFLKAHEVFRRHRIPVTAFVVSGFLDGLWLWYDRVAHMFASTPLTSVRLPRPLREANLPLGTKAQRIIAADVVCEQLKTLPNSQMRVLVDSLPSLLEVSLNGGPPAEDAPLTWNDARRLQSEGVEFGAHSATHPILSKLERDEDLVREFEDSARRIREELGAPPIHFCYPNGQPNDIDLRCVAAAQRTAFRLAVTTTRGLNHPGADRFLLKRLSVEPSLDPLYFRETVAGLHL
jgi:peptidoglycan/xylan/chitin deacetylase (PgdA/CDA1 family)